MVGAVHRAGGGSPDNLPLAIGAILLATFALSLGDALIKALSAGLGLWQIFVLRSGLCLAVLGGAARVAFPGVRWWPHRPVLAGLRSLMLVLMWVLYYVALPHMRLSVAAAVYYTLPLFILVFSAVVERQRMHGGALLAVLLGFAGVLFLLRPDADGIHGYVLLPLGSAILYALSMILTRTACRDEHPLTLTIALHVGFALVGLVGSLATRFGADGVLNEAWLVTGAREWLAIVVLAAAVLVGSYCAAVAYQAGPSATVGIFDFSYVGFAVLWGVLFFAEVPDVWAVLGILMIVCAGLLALRRA